MTATMHETTLAAPHRGVAGWLDRLGRVPLSIHQLLFRLGVASVFLKAGMVKISSWESTVALFRDEYRVPVLPPEIAATMSATFELGCSALLIIGLASRLATLPLLGMIATIQLFVYPDAWSEHLVWGSILVFLLTWGPGAISLDHVIARVWGRGRE
jgi:putative oxidoreductase